MSIEAAAELCLVLRELGHQVELVRRPAGLRDPEGLRLDVVEAPTSTSAAVRRTLQLDEAVGVLVTSRLSPAHRERLTAAGAGWLDRRGQVHIPPLGIDADVAPMVAPHSARDDVWQRGGVVAVALALLQQEEGPVPVTWDLGFYAGLTGGGVSLAMQDLRSLDMIDEHDHPRRDALFAQLAARWHTHWFPLADLPTLGELDEEARLLIAGHDDRRRPGWAVLPHIAKGPDDSQWEELPRLLLADQRALAWLLRTCAPAASTDTAAALVSAAPSPVALAQRQPPESHTGWPTAHPVTAALEHETPGLMASTPNEIPMMTTKSATPAPR